MSSPLQLPDDPLECICQRLSLKDRVRLLSTCKGLQRFGQSNLWCQRALETVDLELSAPPHVPSLHAWLSDRKCTIRRLRLVLEHEEGPGTAVFLLGALAGGTLASLVLGPEPQAGNQADSTLDYHFELGSWVLALPRLQHIECLSSCFIARPPLAGLQGLTYLRLVQPEEQSIHLAVGSLPASLRRLDLGSVSRLPAAVLAATQLEELHLRASQWDLRAIAVVLDVQESELEAQGVERLVNLRSLALDAIELVLPPLAPLKRLEVLSISGLARPQGGGGLQPHVLEGLTNLQRLRLVCGAKYLLEGSRPDIPGLQALSMESNFMFYAAPEGLDLSGLAVLGTDLSCAVPNMSFFAEMPALRELFLFDDGTSPGRVQDNVQRHLPAFWEALSRASRLEKVQVCLSQDVLKLLTRQPQLATHNKPELLIAALLAEWSQLLPARVQLRVVHWGEPHEQVPGFSSKKDWKEV